MVVRDEIDARQVGRAFRRVRGERSAGCLSWSCAARLVAQSRACQHREQQAAPDQRLHPSLLYPPGLVSAGFRQRSTKTQAGAVGVVGQPVAHDDTRQPSKNAAIIQVKLCLFRCSKGRGERSFLLDGKDLSSATARLVLRDPDLIAKAV
jgi:hypothetical protein